MPHGAGARAGRGGEFPAFRAIFQENAAEVTPAGAISRGPDGMAAIGWFETDSLAAAQIEGIS